jgi:hypothetical protein
MTPDCERSGLHEYAGNVVSGLFRAGSYCEEPEKTIEFYRRLGLISLNVQFRPLPSHYLVFWLQKKIAALQILLELKISNALIVSCSRLQAVLDAHETMTAKLDSLSINPDKCPR